MPTLALGFLLPADNLSQTPKTASKLTAVVLAPHIVEILFLIGAGKQIIGTSEYSDYPAEAKKIPRVGNHSSLSIEHIITLQPDVLIVWKTGNLMIEVDKLANKKMKVVYSNPNELDDIADEVIQLGRLFGQTANAQRVAKSFRRDFEALKTRYRHSTPVTVFYELWSQPLRTISNNAWSQKLIGICGASNAFAHLVGDYPSVTVERVLLTNPQIIIQPVSYTKPRREVTDWSKWNFLRAVDGKQVMSFDSDKLHRMTPRVLKELNKMCQRIDNARKYYSLKRN